MTRIAGTRALITGGARGIGRLVAQGLIGRGARVALVDIDEQAVRAAASELGSSARAYVGDLASAESIYAVASEIERDLGAVDILVNNAGVVFGGSLQDVPDEQHALTVEINLMGVVRMTRAILPGMIERGQGHVVNMASASGLTGVAHLSTYAASKWAVIGFSESLLYELQDQGSPVKVTWICPSFIDTGMFHGVKPPMLLPLLKPAEVADAVVEAIERDRREVIMPRLASTAHLLRALLPARARDVIAERMGFNRSMKTWKGR